MGYPPLAFQFAFIEFQSLQTLKCKWPTSPALGALFAELVEINSKGGDAMKKVLLSVACLVALSNPATSNASLITFDDMVSGVTSYGYDGDNDGNNDAVFSTTDPGGFNTVGPGPNMTYIHEPGIEGTSRLNPDLRVDFLVGAIDSLQFGYALNSGSANANTWTNFQVFNSTGALLASATQSGAYTLPNGTNPSSFPEGYIQVTFAGVASYALFDFSSDNGRYIIDDFQGTFGQTEDIPVTPPIPEPSTLLLLGAGLAGIGIFGRRKSRKSI